jgi:hypothetical protein
MAKQIVVRISWSIKYPLKMFSLANNVVSQLKANKALFPFPIIDVNDLELKTELCTTAYNHRKNGSLAKKQYTDKINELNALLHEEAIYVNGIAKGNVENILKSGFETTSKESKKPVVPSSTESAILKTLGNGGLKMSVGKVAGATSYLFVVFTDTVSDIEVDNKSIVISGNPDKVIIVPSSKISETLINLPIGNTVTVVVFAQNSAGISAASPSASRLIN